VAGAFYPDNPATLARLIDGYLAEAIRLEPEPSILIVPHAGYVYSGAIAAHSFKQAVDRAYRHVIVLGFNHGYAYGFSGAAVWPTGRWRTPLGDVLIDDDLARRILASPAFHSDPVDPSRRAQPGSGGSLHSARLPNIPIVPISIGRPSESDAGPGRRPGGGAA
jgi:AmmeMemoRadiSam system protein B